MTSPAQPLLETGMSRFVDKRSGRDSVSLIRTVYFGGIILPQPYLVSRRIFNQRANAELLPDLNQIVRPPLCRPLPCIDADREAIPNDIVALKEALAVERPKAL